MAADALVAVKTRMPTIPTSALPRCFMVVSYSFVGGVAKRWVSRFVSVARKVWRVGVFKHVNPPDESRINKEEARPWRTGLLGDAQARRFARGGANGNRAG